MADTIAILLVGGAMTIALGALLGLARIVRAGYLLQVAGLASVGTGAALVIATDTVVGAGFTSALHISFGVDQLSALLVVILALAGVPTLLSAAGSTLSTGGSGSDGTIAALTGGFVLALACVVTARDVVTLLAGWELMTLLPATAILVYRREHAARRAVFVYLSMTHIAGAGAWLALLVLAANGAIGDASTLSEPMQAAVLVAATIGFGAKAGIMPLHAWLPRAHPAAPAHVSALMSGVMLKVALYGLVRISGWFDAVPTWIAIGVLALAVLSSVGGALQALLQSDLKRLLAFSSIENVGIVLTGIAAWWLLAADGDDRWAAIALTAALLHMLNHALFKSLLFVGAGAVQRAAGSTSLNDLGGLLRRMPVAGWSMLVGCAAIAGVPLLNAFISEWMTVQTLAHGAASMDDATALALAVAAAAVALTAGLALLCFVMVAGMVLLGRPRTPDAASAVEPSAMVGAGLAWLAASCAIVGLVPGIVVPAITSIAATITSDDTPATDVSATGLALPGVSLPFVVAALAVIVIGGILLRLRGRATRTTPVWACGQDPADPALAWTAVGFTTTLRLMLPPALRPHRSAHVVAARTATEALIQQARRLQAGSLATYVAYLVALTIAVLGMLRIGVLG